MRIVVAPDSFKGSLGASAVAEAIRDGWLSERPGDEITLLPFADGGEGTLAAVERCVDGTERIAVRVTGPDGKTTDAHWLRIEEPDGVTAVIELAVTSGIELLGRKLLPWDATSAGFGQAIRDALDAGSARLLLAIGSSASTDGGAGVLTALGASLVDEFGGAIADGVTGLEALARVDLRGLVELPPRGVDVLTDVTNPLLGSRGSAAVFGPQKGIDDIPRAERALERFAALMPNDPQIEGAGAAGGVGYALLAWGARIVPGARGIADLVGLHAAVEAADLAITGEGRFDDQSLHGKVPSAVLDIARVASVPVALIAGQITAPTTDFVAAHELTEWASVDEAMTDPAPYLRRAAASIASSVGSFNTNSARGSIGSADRPHS